MQLVTQHTYWYVTCKVGHCLRWAARGSLECCIRFALRGLISMSFSPVIHIYGEHS